MRDFEGRPFLGTYNPEAYYKMMLEVNPYGAEKETREACVNSGTSQYNPVYNGGNFDFTPLKEEDMSNYLKKYKMHREKEKEDERIFRLEIENKEFKRTIWYKLYKLFGGF